MNNKFADQIVEEAAKEFANYAGIKRKRLKLSDGKMMFVPEHIYNHYKEDIETAYANPDKYKIKRTQNLEGKQIATIECYEWKEEGNSATIRPIFLMLPDIREVMRERKKAKKK